ncbi:hypothetical protein E6O75_ATG07479 [Venturia nashicola]|uniref:Uncharacterized protein n=1 Tax=Venturia nashicola TaxID=86259 RepID=A0A4Z1NXV3_9PEZI|nr:hypothetical protein E6O75_ATG07479 [Venturia nashicola]
MSAQLTSLNCCDYSGIWPIGFQSRPTGSLCLDDVSRFTLHKPHKGYMTPRSGQKYQEDLRPPCCTYFVCKQFHSPLIISAVCFPTVNSTHFAKHGLQRQDFHHNSMLAHNASRFAQGSSKMKITAKGFTASAWLPKLVKKHSDIITIFCSSRIQSLTTFHVNTVSQKLQTQNRNRYFPFHKCVC